MLFSTAHARMAETCSNHLNSYEIEALFLRAPLSISTRTFSRILILLLGNSWKKRPFILSETVLKLFDDYDN